MALSVLEYSDHDWRSLKFNEGTHFGLAAAGRWDVARVSDAALLSVSRSPSSPTCTPHRQQIAYSSHPNCIRWCQPKMLPMPSKNWPAHHDQNTGSPFGWCHIKRLQVSVKTMHREHKHVRQTAPGSRLVVSWLNHVVNLSPGACPWCKGPASLMSTLRRTKG